MSATIEKQPILVLEQSAVNSLIQEASTVDLANMPRQYKSTGRFNHITISRKPDGEVQTIQDLNKDRYRYAWLDDADLATGEFDGYRKVVRGQEGSFGPNGEAIPDKEFAGRNVIQRGKQTYCFALTEWEQSRKENSRRIAENVAVGLGAQKSEDGSFQPLGLKVHDSEEELSTQRKGRK